MFLCLLGLLFDREDGGDTSHRNIGELILHGFTVHEILFFGLKLAHVIKQKIGNEELNRI
jgi:hypothetical protein